MKTCTKCGLSKPEEGFYYIKRSQGYDTRCKACVSEYLKARRRTPEGQAANRAGYQRRAANGYQQKPWSEKTQEQRTRCYDAVKRWREKHRDRFNGQDRQGKQLLRSLAFRKAWPAILEHYEGVCVCCGGGKPCFDHVIPLSQQGPNLLTNGQPLCRACNTAKGQMNSAHDYRQDEGAWIRQLVALNPWLGEPMPSGRWHLQPGGRERLARLRECAERPLVLPSDDARSSA